MGLHYIIDGYNVIHKTPFLDHEKLKDAREALLRFIDKYRPQGSPKNKITVVFDGKDNFLNFPSQFDTHIVFTKGESADDYIKSFVDRSRNPKNLRIVSNDKDLVLYCRSAGSSIISVDIFIKSCCNKKNLRKRKTEGFFELTFLERKKINEELSKIWLKKSNKE